jgi:hypothetical protein
MLHFAKDMLPIQFGLSDDCVEIVYSSMSLDTILGTILLWSIGISKSNYMLGCDPYLSPEIS